jgi:hypothetical protein
VTVGIPGSGVIAGALTIAKAAPDRRRSSAVGRTTGAAVGAVGPGISGNGATGLGAVLSSAALGGEGIGPNGGKGISACARLASLACALWRASAGRAAACV